ncbi:hypothetical protein [Leifsonia sp. Root227]|uniref:hypothetical protein n=1 Tax=Leifsonia sp. Root227 TaxID=1736496 RepID=UPI000A5417E1|nr:hypothetical protein [Leifsonia sp. Root227]
MNHDEGFTALAVAIGRIEEKVNSMTGMDDRLREVEKSVERIEAREVPRAPWYAVVGGIAGVVATVVSAVTLIAFVAQGTAH